MTDVAGLVNELIAAGAEPSVAARIVTLAFVAGHASSDNTDSVLAKRRERDRVRKQQERALSKDIQGQEHNNELDKTETVQACPRTSVDSVDIADNGSLSPVPLLSPTPPNNPLTPKPSTKTKSARGQRLPADWTMNGPDLAYALGKGLSEREAGDLFERFCSWAWSASGSNAVKVNWHQAWQGWVQRDGPKIISARGSPNGKPLTAFQQRRQETQGILDELDDFAAGRSGGDEAHSGILPGHSGEQSQNIRGGTGGAVIDLPATSYRTGR